MRFVFGLCRELGLPHPDYLLPHLTASQLVDWWVLSQIEPWGETRADQREAASLAVEAGMEDWTLSYPYYYKETAEEVLAEFEEIKRRIRTNASHRQHDSNSD